MSNVISVVTAIFERIFVTTPTDGVTLFGRLITLITASSYLYIGVVLVVVGFSVSIIKRIIHS